MQVLTKEDLKLGTVLHVAGVDTFGQSYYMPVLILSDPYLYKSPIKGSVLEGSLKINVRPITVRSLMNDGFAYLTDMGIEQKKRYNNWASFTTREEAENHANKFNRKF